MPSDFAFRLCTYLTLALSCICLGYSEWDLLPEVTGFTATVIVLLMVSFVFEGRWVLNLRQANRMGFAIGVLALLWVGFQFVRPSGGLIYVLPWPASLLPYLGPLLMVLMPAKLFRPKHAGDWLAMHGIAQVEAERQHHCRLHFSLWSGNLGFAIYLGDCICGTDRFPFIDVFFGDAPPGVAVEASTMRTWGVSSVG